MRFAPPVRLEGVVVPPARAGQQRVGPDVAAAEVERLELAVGEQPRRDARLHRLLEVRLEHGGALKARSAQRSRAQRPNKKGLAVAREDVAPDRRVGPEQHLGGGPDERHFFCAFLQFISGLFSTFLDLFSGSLNTLLQFVSSLLSILTELLAFLPEIFSSGGQVFISIPLWLLAAICLAWPVTSLLLARRRRKGRGFAVEPAADAAPPAIDPRGKSE